MAALESSRGGGGGASPSNGDAVFPSNALQAENFRWAFPGCSVRLEAQTGLVLPPRPACARIRWFRVDLLVGARAVRGSLQRTRWPSAGHRRSPLRSQTPVVTVIPGPLSACCPSDRCKARRLQPGHRWAFIPLLLGCLLSVKDAGEGRGKALSSQIFTLRLQ